MWYMIFFKAVISGGGGGGGGGGVRTHDYFSSMCTELLCFVEPFDRLKSCSRMVIPASFRFLSRWQTPKSFLLASAIPEWSHARSTHALWVRLFSTLVAPFMPWMVKDHFRLWTFTSRVWSARTVATFSMWNARAGIVVLHTSSTLWGVNFSKSSISWHVLCNLTVYWFGIQA